MRTIDKYQLLKSSFEFTSDLIKYSQILEQNHHRPIALKIMNAAVKINSFLFDAQTAYRHEDVVAKLEKAKSSIHEVIYWLKQCVKSNYFDLDDRILRKAKYLEADIGMSLCPEVM